MESQSVSQGELPGRGPVLLALRYYGRELARLWRWAVPGMLLPALGNIGIFYIAPLVVAKLVGRIADITIGSTLPYVLGFAGILLFAETLASACTASTTRR
ncbi:hypothetical protein ACQEVY_06175 [Streptomyces sp. CA-288835]|uniref:hypothetical protein n=1 Tax=Streptomyces sp. CA-288835 TaxID=3240069 RepID=UPI003D9025B1